MASHLHSPFLDLHSIDSLPCFWEVEWNHLTQYYCTERDQMLSHLVLFDYVTG